MRNEPSGAGGWLGHAEQKGPQTITAKAVIWRGVNCRGGSVSTAKQGDCHCRGEGLAVHVGGISRDGAEFIGNERQGEYSWKGEGLMMVGRSL